MYHTVLRTFIRKSNAPQKFNLPAGVRRVKVQPEISTSYVRIGWASSDLSFTAGPGSPWDSGYHLRDSGPIWFTAPQTGAFIRVDVWHTDSNINSGSGGPGGAPGPGQDPDNTDPHEFCTVFKPAPNTAVIPTHLAGEWNILPDLNSWNNIAGWGNPDQAIAALLGTDPHVLTTSTLFMANAWRRQGAAIPAAAIIKRIRVRLLASNVGLSGLSTDHELSIASLRLIQNGLITDYDYADQPSNQNQFWFRGDAGAIDLFTSPPNSAWIEYEPQDDPLWGESWTAADFVSSLSGSPQITVIPIQQGSAALNEKQVVTLPNSPTGGAFTLTFEGQTTTALAHNASAAAVDAALETLSTINTVTTTGSDGGPWTIEFTGTHAAIPQTKLQGTGTSLTGAITATVDVVQQSTEQQTGNRTNTTLSLIARDTNWPSLWDRQMGIGLFTLSGTTWIGLPTSISALLPIETWFPPDVALTETRFNSAATSTMEAVSWIGSGNIRVYNEWTENSDPDTGRRYLALRFEFIGAFAGQERFIIHYANGVRHGPQIFFTNVNGVLNGRVVADYVDETSYYSGVNPPRQYQQIRPNGIYSEGIVESGGRSIAPANEIQRITFNNLSPGGGGGAFTITFQGQTTSAISLPTNASAIDTALEALSNIDSVTTIQVGLGQYTIEFTGVNAGLDVAPMIVDTSSSTGGSVSIVRTQNGAAGQNEIQRVYLTGGNTGGVWGLTWDPGGGDETTADLARDISTTNLQTALVALATPVAGDILVTGTPGIYYDVEFDQNFGDSNVNMLRPKSALGSSPFGLVAAVGISTLNPDAPEGSVRALIHDAEIVVCYTV